MIGEPQDISTMTTELGYSVQQMDIDWLLSAMGVSGNPDSFDESEGFDGDWYDFVQVIGGCYNDLGGGDYEVVLTLYNYGTVNDRSGTCYWNVYDQYDNYLGGSSTGFGAISPLSQDLLYGCYVYNAGNPPYYVTVKTNSSASSYQRVDLSGSCS